MSNPRAAKVGRYQNGATAVTELVKRPVPGRPVPYRHEKRRREFLRFQVGKHTLHAFAVVYEHQCRMVAKRTKQAVQRFQFIFLG